MADYLMRIAASGASVASPARPPQAASLPVPPIRALAITPATGLLNDFANELTDEVHFEALPTPLVNDPIDSPHEQIRTHRVATHFPMPVESIASALAASPESNAPRQIAANANINPPQTLRDLSQPLRDMTTASIPLERTANFSAPLPESNTSEQIATEADLIALQPQRERGQPLRDVTAVSTQFENAANPSAQLPESTFPQRAVTPSQVNATKAEALTETRANKEISVGVESSESVRVPRGAPHNAINEIPIQQSATPVAVSVRMPKGLRPSTSSIDALHAGIKHAVQGLPNSDPGSETPVTMDRRSTSELPGVSLEVNTERAVSSTLAVAESAATEMQQLPLSRMQVQSTDWIPPSRNPQPVAPADLRPTVPLPRIEITSKPPTPIPQDFGVDGGVDRKMPRQEAHQSRLTIGRVDVNVSVEAPATQLNSPAPPPVESHSAEMLDRGFFDRFSLRY